MSEFLADPSVLTKDKLKSALVANNVALPNGEQRKGVYVELYLKNLTSQNKKSSAAPAPTPTPAPDAFSFSSDEELPAPVVSNKSRSGRKATRKTDRVRPEEIDVTELTNEGLKDQLLKYGINAGPIVVSTRKVYEKKLQKLLDLGPPEAVISLSEPARTDSSQNGNTDSDQYSDKEEETPTAVPEPEPEPEPEPDPVPVVERPLRSRGKTPVTTRTRSGQHKTWKEDEQEEDFQVMNVQRKSRRSSRRLDQTVPASDDTDVSELSAAEMLSAPQERKRAAPSLNEGGAASSAAPSEEMQVSILNTAVLQASFQEPKSVSLAKHTKRSIQPRSSSAQPSEDLIHMMCRLSPPPARQNNASPPPPAEMDSPCRPAQEDPLSVIKSSSKDHSGSSAALSRGKQTKIRPFLSPVTPVRGQGNSFGDQTPLSIEKLSAVEHTPKPAERDVLKELFPNETFNTPTGISATRRQPIKGAAGRPFSDAWRDELRPRLTELRQTISSYTESRSISRASATPLSSAPLSSVPLSSIPKPAAPPSVQAKTRRRLPVWVQLLLLSAVAGFLFFVYQAMETNEISPFGQPESSGALKGTSK
ncbi:thymopoietin a isoform X2 [Pygocentrus nattereri]|uniref:thymopoietin a isoform X2 n=1 Tax=Pygocentrus nattereri TaxID=42514 RepID=UPI000814771D|nr:thymopoietin a isoform X2 [Pygocentrus nattereri]